LARVAGDALNRQYDDPDSLATHFGKNDQGFQTGFLDSKEREIMRGQIDKSLEPLGTFYTPEGLNDILSNQAAKAESDRPGVAPVIIALVADLNGLKQINDNAGHKVGDRAIYSAAAALKSALRESDLIARANKKGDEFLVFITASNLTEAHSIMEVARFNDDGDRQPSIIEAIKRKLEELRTELKLLPNWPEDTAEKRPGTLSLGWHYFEANEFADRHNKYLATHKDGETFLSFLTREADQKMYQMKQGKK